MVGSAITTDIAFSCNGPSGNVTISEPNVTTTTGYYSKKFTFTDSMATGKYTFTVTTYVEGVKINTMDVEVNVYKKMSASIDGEGETVYTFTDETETLKVLATGGKGDGKPSAYTYEWYMVTAAGVETKITGIASSDRLVAFPSNDYSYKCKVSDGVGTVDTGIKTVRAKYHVRFNKGYDDEFIDITGEKKYNDTYTIPDIQPPKREGYEFVCWKDEEDDTEYNEYYNVISEDVNRDVVLTAIWQPELKVKAPSKVAIGKTVKITVSNDIVGGISYEPANNKVIAYKNGALKAVGYGTTTVEVLVSGSEIEHMEEASKKVKITVVPAKISSKSVKVKKKKGKPYLVWKVAKKGKTSKKIKYEVQLYSNGGWTSRYSSTAKKQVLPSHNGLKFRVRAFYKKSGKKVYGAYSSKKGKKIKW